MEKHLKNTSRTVNGCSALNMGKYKNNLKIHTHTVLLCHLSGKYNFRSEESEMHTRVTLAKLDV